MAGTPDLTINVFGDILLSMKYFQEVTVWDAGYAVPNHIYYMKDDKSKAVGYIPAGKKKLVIFSKPMSIESRGRKFIVLDKKGEPDEVYFPKVTEKPVGQVIEVSGSNGKKYFLSKIGKTWNCTCPGYQFRHKCKHTDEIKANI